MCGIAGILSRQPIDETALHRMLAAMAHRGPDDEGVARFSIIQSPISNLHLGMRRLAIIDLSGGRQPMFNEDGTLAVVFNGEIYNFPGLRRELEQRGHRFRTRSDTETIVHAYEEWGPECVHRFRGMFAFAVYDRRGPTPTLFLARDRLGIKPLYYYQGEGYFVFASEVRALFASGLVRRRLSLDGLHSYLLFGSVQEPLSLVEGVYSLPPGHWMRWKVGEESWGIEVKRYWDFPVPQEEWSAEGVMSLEKVRSLLEESVSMRLISDVPLGAFLSGGLDSGAVVALMSRVGKGAPRTFTVVFEEKAFDEGDVARVTARRFATDHTEVRVTPAEVLAELPRALVAMDQPTMDGINTYFVSRAAREAGLTVALSGLGGDEIFAGYSTFRTVPRLQRLARLLPPLPLRPPALFPSSRFQKLAAFLTGDIPFSHPYFLARALFTPRQVQTLLTRQAQERLCADTPWHRRVRGTLERAKAYDPINAVSYLECSHYLLSTLLRDTDQMSMAHSLEVRVPLIDHRLVEFMFALPGPWKVHPPLLRATSHLPSATRYEPQTNKPLLVAALNGALPPEIVHRRKTTFTFPWEQWLRGPLREEVGRTLSRPPEVLRDIVDVRTVRRVWDAFLAGRTTWSRPWALYVLFRWVENVGGIV